MKYLYPLRTLIISESAPGAEILRYFSHLIHQLHTTQNRLYIRRSSTLQFRYKQSTASKFCFIQDGKELLRFLL